MPYPHKHVLKKLIYIYDFDNEHLDKDNIYCHIKCKQSAIIVYFND